jgi:hypothetical protein
MRSDDFAACAARWALWYVNNFGEAATEAG